MSVKGYVVRGTDHEGERCAAYVWQDGHDEMDALSSDEHTIFTEFARADRARGMMWVRCCTDVRIYAVADDGTETAVPTYEEALAQVNALTKRLDDDRHLARYTLGRARALLSQVAEKPHDEQGHLAETTCHTCHADYLLDEIDVCVSQLGKDPQS